MGILAALALAGALAIYIFSVAQPAFAQSTVTRDFSADRVALGMTLDVTVTNTTDGISSVDVTETLPEGWTFDSMVNPSDLDHTVSGQDVTFKAATIQGVTYRVTAPDTAGDYTFSGTFNGTAVSGDTTVTVYDPAANGGNGEEAGPESASLTTNKASSATRLTIMGSGEQLGSVGPGDEIVINLADFGLPASIDEADVTIDDGYSTAHPESVSVGGSNITLLLGKFAGDKANNDAANVIDENDDMIRITVRDRAGITTPNKAGMYEVKVDAKDLSDDGDTYDLSGDEMMVSIIRSISVSPGSATRGTEITITGKGFSDGSAAVTAGGVGIGAADIASGSFTLTVNNNIKVNNVSAFAKGADGTDIQATDGAGDSAASAATHKIKAAFTADPESPNPGQSVTITLADTDVTSGSSVMVSFGGATAVAATNTDDGKDTTWSVGVPSNVRRGTIQMSVTVDSAAALTKNITIATNPLTVTPSTVVPGQTISVTGSGFKGASTIAAGGVVIGSIAANAAELLVNNVGSVTFDVSVPDAVATGDMSRLWLRTRPDGSARPPSR